VIFGPVHFPVYSLDKKTSLWSNINLNIKGNKNVIYKGNDLDTQTRLNIITKGFSCMGIYGGMTNLAI
jgi:hypothetical protein